MAKLNKPLLYAFGAAVVGFLVVRQVFAAKGAPTTYKGNTYVNEKAAQEVKDTEALFAAPTRASMGGSAFVEVLPGSPLSNDKGTVYSVGGQIDAISGNRIFF